MPTVPVATQRVGVGPAMGVRAPQPSMFSGMPAPRDAAAPTARAPLVTIPDAPPVPHFNTPQFDTPQLVTPQVSATLRSAMAQPNHQLEDAGRTLGSIAQVGEKIVDSIQTQTNNTLADEATNRARELQMQLTHGDQGFTKLRGGEVVNRPDNKPLSEEYVGKFDDGLNSILDTIHSEPARRAFIQRAGAMRLSLEDQVMQHEASQLRDWHLSTAQGTAQLAAQSIFSNRLNPTQVTDDTLSLRAAIGEAGHLQGLAAPMIEANMLAATTKAHMEVVKDALDAGNVDFAKAYLEGHAVIQPLVEGAPAIRAISEDAMMTARTLINKQADEIISDDIGRTYVRDAISGSTDTDFNRLNNIVAQTDPTYFHPAMLDERMPGLTRVVLKNEGGGTLDNEKVSPKGAKGPMQVMPGTQTDPGFGVRPARDDSPQERARVGRDYLKAMVGRYDGDADKALAAYNAGPGAVDAAIKKGERNGTYWITNLPKETRDYVVAGRKQLDAGKGTYTKPTLEGVLDEALADPRVAGSPTRRKQVTESVTRAWTIHQQAEKQQDDSSMEAAYGWLDANNGNYAAMPQSLKEAVHPSKRDSLRAFGTALAKGEEPQTNWQMYAELRSNPDLLAGINIGAMRGKLANSEFKELLGLQSTLRAKDATAADRRTRLLNADQVLNSSLRQIGLNPNPKPGSPDAEKVGRAQQAFAQRIDAAEAIAKRPLTTVELQKEAAMMFAQVDVKGGGAWFSSKKPVFEVQPTEHIVIPAGERKKIEAALVAQLMPVTDANMRMMYLKTKGAQ